MTSTTMTVRSAGQRLHSSDSRSPDWPLKITKQRASRIAVLSQFRPFIRSNKWNFTTYQIKSNQIYLPTQNIKEKQLKNIRLTHKKSTTYIQTMNASRTQRQSDCSYMSPKKAYTTLFRLIRWWHIVGYHLIKSFSYSACYAVCRYTFNRVNVR